jgi:hypothetical protein
MTVQRWWRWRWRAMPCGQSTCRFLAFSGAREMSGRMWRCSSTPVSGSPANLVCLRWRHRTPLIENVISCDVSAVEVQLQPAVSSTQTWLSTYPGRIGAAHSLFGGSASALLCRVSAVKGRTANAPAPRLTPPSVSRSLRTSSQDESAHICQVP